eukprot:7375893-Prymnesium_polylepis.2
MARDTHTIIRTTTHPCRAQYFKNVPLRRDLTPLRRSARVGWFVVPSLTPSSSDPSRESA